MVNSVQQVHSYDRKILVIVGLGLALSIYSLYVEIKHDLDESYEALCDINSLVSCSAAFFSDFGRGFGLLPEPLAFRNPVFGVLFYTTVLILILLGHKLQNARLLVALAILSNLGSLFLGFVLTFVLRVACLVCISTYVINFLLLKFTWRRLKLIQHSENLQSQKRRH